MNLLILFRLAMESILKNRTRAALTMLGIVIGVAAVIVMVAVGYGARSRIREQIDNLGTNMIVITPGASTTGGVSQGAQAFATLTVADAEKIRSQSQTVVAVSPVIVGRSQVIAPGRQLAHVDQRRRHRLPDDPGLADGLGLVLRARGRARGAQRGRAGPDGRAAHLRRQRSRRAGDPDRGAAASW